MNMDQTDPRLTDVERTALAVALGDPRFGAQPWLDTVDRLRVVARESSSVGFYTKFARDSTLVRQVPNANFDRRHPVSAMGVHPQVEGFVDFLVWIEDGQIDCLEASATGELPEDLSQLRIQAFPED